MKIRTQILVACACVWAAGCADAKPDSSTTQHELESGENTLPGDDRAEANEHERRMKKAAADPTPGGPTAEDIDWEEARGFKRVAPTALPETEQKRLPSIRVPVLGFDDDALLASGLVTHNADWYVLAVESDDGLNMNVRGTRNAWRAPNMQIPQAARDAAENYTLTRTHGVVTVSWRAFNASYSLDIECAKPMDDARCTQDAFALQVTESLGLLGGTP